MSPPAVVLSCSRFCSDVITVHHAFTPRPRDRVVDLISRAEQCDGLIPVVRPDSPEDRFRDRHV